MSTDRELLELAAKAAGFYMLWWPDQPGSGKRTKIGAGTEPWDPLIDGDDALKLAVRLKLHMGLEIGVSNVWIGGLTHWQTVAHDSCADADEATRRAIVLCAASIGMAMP